MTRLPVRISAAEAKRLSSRGEYFAVLRERLAEAEALEPAKGRKDRDPLGAETHHFIKDGAVCGCGKRVQDMVQIMGLSSPLSISEPMCRDCAMKAKRKKR